MRGTLIILLTLSIALITTPVFAKNRVLSLDGDGDYVEIEDSEALNSIDSQVTIEAWFYYSGKWMPIIDKGDGRNDKTSYGLWLVDNGGLRLYAAPSNISLPNYSVEPNTWYHIAGIIDAPSGVMKILLNGAEVAKRDFGKEIYVSALPLLIGWTYYKEQPPEDAFYLYSPFAGQIDEVRIWNIARTQEEIQTTMFTTLSGKESGLVGYWRFDDLDNIAT